MILAPLLLFVASPRAATQTAGEKERVTAFAVNMNAPAPAEATATVEISIDRWSTEAERKALITTLVERGPRALLSALQDQPPVGRIRTPDSLGYDLRYAHQQPAEDGGRRIVIATDRPIGYWEAINRPRSLDYPFTIIEMRIGPDGTGQGKMSVATKVIAVGDVIALENYDTLPVRLQAIRAEKSK